MEHDGLVRAQNPQTHHQSPVADFLAPNSQIAMNFSTNFGGNIKVGISGSGGVEENGSGINIKVEEKKISIKLLTGLRPAAPRSVK
eukprot:g56428.t1